MNNDKVGAPFQYSDSYVQFLAFLKIDFKIPYLMVQGIVRGLSDYVRIEEIHFTHIRRRMIRVKPSILEIDFVNDNNNGKEEEPITLIVDASGLTVSRKGHYIEQK
jgi:hypothetical protein